MVLAYNTSDRLSEAVLTLYAELLQQAQATPFAGLRGTFVSKRVRGRRYWYLQVTTPIGRKQLYVGPDREETHAQMELALGHWAALEDDLAQRRELVTMLRAGGALTGGGGALKILELLEQVGVFCNGGVLIGSHAFVAYGNMLGFCWDKASLRTQDVDIAGGERISIAAEPPGESDLAGTLLGAGMGFFEVPALDLKQPSTSYKVRGRQLHVDVLTPLLGRASDKPVFLPSLKTAAQPLRFLDYLLEETQPAVLVGGAGVLVQVPHPARFALHKLLTSARRPVSQHGKVKKDLRQAEQVLAALMDEQAGDLAAAWQALALRGERWLKRVEEGARGLRRELWDEVRRRAGAV